MQIVTDEEWKECQKYERESWGNDIYITDDNVEVEKQNTYAKLMEIVTDEHFDKIDLQNKSILDVGCGPVSLLLRCKNFKRAVGIEPLFYSEQVNEIYKKSNIELLQIPAENMDFKTNEFDEVWMYNVLQHVKSPGAILEKLIQYGSVIRIFEWINIPAHEGHPHMLTAQYFIQKLNLIPSEYNICHFNTEKLQGKAIVIILQKRAQK